MTSPTNFPNRRRRCFIDPRVQGALLRQAIHYWLWALAVFGLISFVYRIAPAWLSNEQESIQVWRDLGPYMLASAVLFPIMAVSAIRFSNRFAGPMVRVRAALKLLAQGETPPRLSLRNDDFWSDIAADINHVADKLRQAPSPTPTATNIADHAWSPDLACDDEANEFNLVDRN